MTLSHQVWSFLVSLFSLGTITTWDPNSDSDDLPPNTPHTTSYNDPSIPRHDRPAK